MRQKTTTAIAQYAAAAPTWPDGQLLSTGDLSRRGTSGRGRPTSQVTTMNVDASRIGRHGDHHRVAPGSPDGEDDGDGDRGDGDLDERVGEQRAGRSPGRPAAACAGRRTTARRPRPSAHEAGVVERSGEQRPDRPPHGDEADEPAEEHQPVTPLERPRPGAVVDAARQPSWAVARYPLAPRPANDLRRVRGRGRAGGSGRRGHRTRPTACRSRPSSRRRRRRTRCAPAPTRPPGGGARAP